MAKHKKAAKGFVRSSVETIDFSPMREKVDGLKKTVNSLPDGKQKTTLMKQIEDLYLWAGGYFNNFVESIGLNNGAVAPTGGEATA